LIIKKKEIFGLYVGGYWAERAQTNMTPSTFHLKKHLSMIWHYMFVTDQFRHTGTSRNTALGCPTRAAGADWASVMPYISHAGSGTQVSERESCCETWSGEEGGNAGRGGSAAQESAMTSNM
jgi:hypothetical protein